MIEASLIWAPATVTVAFLGHRVAVRWLDARDRANVAAEQRNEREAGAVARIEAMEAELKSMKTRIETWIANNGARR